MNRAAMVVLTMCLTITLILVTSRVAEACDMDISTNYWFHLNHNIEDESLPPTIEVNFSRPAYGQESYKAKKAMAGELILTNTGDTPVYLIPDEAIYEIEAYRGRTSPYARELVMLAGALEQNEVVDPTTYTYIFDGYTIAAGTTYTYSTYTASYHLMENPESPGGIGPLPDPYSFELMLIHGNQTFRIPVTTTYSINPFYDDARIGTDAPLSDYMILTDMVALGTVIGAGENSTIQDEESEDQIFGIARIQVEEWLLGDGPTEIEVGNFGSPSASCQISTAINQRAYFLLQSIDDSTSNQYSLTRQDDSAKTVLSYTKGNYDLVADALLDIKNVIIRPRFWITLPLVGAGP